MKTLPLIGLLAACCVMGTVWAAEPAPAKPAATPAASPAAPAKPAATESATPKSDEDPQVKDEEKQAAKSKPTAADKAGDKASPQRFVPSEQVRADFDVSFPIDI